MSDDEPGYTRKRCGRGFSYRDHRGRTVTSARLRRRFEALVIPPAWTNVWICRHEDGHLQVTGRDAAGRKQYIYHPAYRRARERAKYRKVAAFGRALPRVRRHVARDLRRQGLCRERVMAAIVRLLETSLARVGSDEYARDNDSFGLTTLRKKHVKGRVLEFTGKSGRPWRIEVRDARVAAVIEACAAAPGRELFKYFDADGKRCSVSAAGVNEYLREVAGSDVSAKDFRTWAGTLLAAVAFEEVGNGEVARAVVVVAEALGNTPAISRQSYMHPEVVSGFESGELVTDVKPSAKQKKELEGLSDEEAALVVFLEKRVG